MIDIVKKVWPAILVSDKFGVKKYRGGVVITTQMGISSFSTMYEILIIENHYAEIIYPIRTKDIDPIRIASYFWKINSGVATNIIIDKISIDFFSTHKEHAA